MKLLRRIGYLALYAALTAKPAAADGDPGAGIQSVFATGFGNRALAMGSAFVAAGDDASALSWNPAGLAFLRRPEAQLSQSNGLGLGFHEATLALGLPDWRWGTGAMSIRNFGVGDLEQRDDRNQLVSSDLSDQELEFALGYANTLGPVSLGGTLKAQRQSIAGLSAMGVGADAGVRFVPARLLGLDSPRADRLVFGFAIRNLLQPSLRLDRESVNDPTTLRTGLAWQAPAGPVGNLLAEIDLEHVASGGTAMRTGFEMRPIPATALRAGLNGDRLTAGAGFQWHGVSFDYVYQDNPVAAEHRMGIAYAFGRDVDEARAAALKKEDDRLQARLEDVYRQRQASQLAGLLARSDSARTAGRFDDAIDALGSARTLAPDDVHIAQLELALFGQKAAALMAAGDFTAAALTYDQILTVAPGDSAAMNGAREARRQSDARTARSAELRTRYDRALDDFGEGRLASARANLMALLGEAPADSDAAAMLRRTDVAIARGVARALDQAGDELRAGRPGDALATLKTIDDLDPATPELAARRAECERALRTQSAAAPAAPAATHRTATKPQAPATAPPQMPAMDPGELARLYRRGVDSQAAGRFDDAIRSWEMVQASSPGYRGVDQALVREYLTRGMESFSTGHLDDAIHSWEQVLRIDPADTRAQGYLARAREQAARRRQMFGAAQ